MSSSQKRNEHQILQTTGYRDSKDYPLSVKIKGLKIDAAKEQLKANRRNVTNRVKIIDTLSATRNTLENMLKALNKRK